MDGFQCQDPRGCRERGLRWAVQARRFADQGERARLAHLSLPPDQRDLDLDTVAHSRRRRFGRAVSLREAREAFEHGEVIHDSVQGNGFRRMTVLGRAKLGPRQYRPLHVVVEYDPEAPGYMVVVTTYDPRNRPWAWDGDFRTRRCWCKPDGEEED